MDFDIKQTVRQFVLSIGALGIVLIPLSAGVAAENLVNQPTFKLALDTSAANAKQELPVPPGFVRYQSAKFNVDYPQEWQIASQEEHGVAIVSIADGVNMLIRTDIVMLREDPQTAVPQRLDQIVAEAVAVQRYSLVAVDGQSGFRIWYEPAAGQQALITFVGYGNEQTVVLSSQYSQGTSAADELVTQIHDSFVNNSIAQALKPEL